MATVQQSGGGHRGAQRLVIQAVYQRQNRWRVECVLLSAPWFDAGDEAIGSVLAAHAAAAILASRRDEDLQSAIASRDLIGQAKGIIMERFHVDAVRAFELLRELSQTTNIRLVEVARRIVDG